MRSIRWFLLTALLLSFGAVAHTSQKFDKPYVVDGKAYESRGHFMKSEGRRCGTPIADVLDPDFEQDGAFRTSLPQADCSSSLTNPTPDYDPGNVYVIDIVWHVIRNSSGTVGDVSDALIATQIDILNEDFRAITGTNGANGNDAGIEFRTDQIIRYDNDTWFNDAGAYYNTIAVDPGTKLNVYTNQAGGNLGYVPWLPASNPGGIGGNSDRVVCLWDAVGRDAPIGPPYDQGRTMTHEVGHWLGLLHTFSGGCATGTSPGCYSSGDRICDTNSESSPHFDCSGSPTMTCSSVDPIDNYMDYGDDLCMEKFTVEQLRRMRCTLESWRPNHYSVVAASTPGTARLDAALRQNYPNPFNPTTTISFELASAGEVTLKVFNVQGQLVRTLASGQHSQGTHEVRWNGTNERGAKVSSGIYLYRLNAGAETITRQMVLLK